ncbi:FAD-dependent oxidoreductase [bacterium]|nr:FAD-dependent oxidoreductase [bacterium]
MAAADIAIIGAGVIGCAIARELAGRGAGRIVVIDRGEPGGEASGAAAGMLAVASSRARRGALADLKRASAALAAPFAAALAAETGIEVEYAANGVLDLAFSSREAERLDRFATRQRERGFAVELLDGDAVRARHPEINPAVRAAARFADDASLNAGRLVEALHVAAARRGVEFRLGTPLRRIVARRRRVEALAVGDDLLPVGRVVIAAGAWSGAVGSLLRAPIPVCADRGEMLAVRPRAPLALPMFWGDACLVPRPSGEVLIGSTSAPRARAKMVTAAGAALLLGRAVRMVPELADAPVTRVWSGLRPLSRLGRPLLGPLRGWDNVTLACGHHRTGVLLAPITARLIAELLLEGATSIDLQPFCSR